jgi:hypothetical protein
MSATTKLKKKTEQKRASMRKDRKENKGRVRLFPENIFVLVWEQTQQGFLKKAREDDESREKVTRETSTGTKKIIK